MNGVTPLPPPARVLSPRYRQEVRPWGVLGDAGMRHSDRGHSAPRVPPAAGADRLPALAPWSLGRALPSLAPEPGLAQAAARSVDCTLLNIVVWIQPFQHTRRSVQTSVKEASVVKRRG